MSFSLSAESIHILRREMRDLLVQYEIREDRNYRPTDHGLAAIINEWMTKKNALLEAFSRHPHYDGHYKIVLSEDMYRNKDNSSIKSFGEYIARMMNRYNRSIAVMDCPIKVGDRVRILDGSADPKYCTSWVNGMTSTIGREGVVESVDKWWMTGKFGIKLKGNRFFYDADYLELLEDRPETEKPEPFTDEQINFFNELSEMGQYMDKDEIDKINAAFPWLKAHNGSKTSRNVRRICHQYKFDEDADFNGKYTKFADGINPLKITRWTILSLHPVDFYTMSFGNSWASCHTIDKTNIRDMPNDYSGMYSGGTESYMLDPSSFVVYTIEAAYDGTHYELQPKINRQMFHFGEDKLVQGRLYPQDNDSGAEDMYRQIRAIVQRVISECFGFTNLWENKKGTYACEHAIISRGVHYRDYENFDNCNVSILKGSENDQQMVVGADPICPECGERHHTDDCIVCRDCANEMYCDNCGCVVRRDDYDHIEVEGNVYCCSECAENAGYHLCNDGYWRHETCRDVIYDDYEEEWLYDPRGYWENRVEVDGLTFATEENAVEYGYRYCDDVGEWVYENNAYYCGECGHWVTKDSWDADNECCVECARNREEIA